MHFCGSVGQVLDTYFRCPQHLVMFGNNFMDPVGRNTPYTMSVTLPPPTPQHILRLHPSPISALSTSGDNERIYSGDASGKVIVTSTRSLRAITQWNAHTDSILGVEEWDKYIVTYVCDFLSHHLFCRSTDLLHADMPEIINFMYGKGLRRYLSPLNLVVLPHYPAYLSQHYVIQWTSMPSTSVVFRCSNRPPDQKKNPKL